MEENIASTVPKEKSYLDLPSCVKVLCFDTLQHYHHIQSSDTVQKIWQSLDRDESKDFFCTFEHPEFCVMKNYGGLIRLPDLLPAFFVRQCSYGSHRVISFEERVVVSPIAALIPSSNVIANKRLLAWMVIRSSVPKSAHQKGGRIEAQSRQGNYGALRSSSPRLVWQYIEVNIGIIISIGSALEP